MPHYYKAMILEGVGSKAAWKDMQWEAPKAGEAAVRLKAAALNRRDLWIQKGRYANQKFPVVPGSDGAGMVEEVGPGVDSSWKGLKVILNPSLDWGQDQEAPGKAFRILGMPDAGTWAEWIKIPAANLAPLPDHLSFEEAAALPLAGLTAYRALFTRAKVRAGEKVLITGIGGGVAQSLFHFALAAKAKVYVTSGSPEKLEKAKSAGAAGGAIYLQDDWDQALIREAGFFDCIVDSAGGPGFPKLCDLAKPGGRIVFFGATAGNSPEFSLRKIFGRQLSLLGTTMGSPGEFASMVGLVRDAGIHPVIDKVFPLAEANEALARMEAGGQFGKIVLRIGYSDEQ